MHVAGIENAGSSTDRDLSEENMVIGTSAIIDTEIDGAVGMNSGIFNNPFMIWGRYRKKLFRYFGKVIEAGHIYELGYEKCTCPKVQSCQVTDPDQCNCSRQSILYILSCLEPNSKFEVEILETILRGAEHCRFQITKY